ncbi:uncharacterized protein LOC143579967 [Bidens hawaiensis]|uniref:uncharacterized protein LOC143579967 n=1 Tax=Bidens hawaiensis TaxID=980011 RepID=UPI00404A138D
MVSNPAPTNNNNACACFQCGGLDHFKNSFLQLAPNNNQATRGRAFTIGALDARQDPNVITGTFLLNNQFASILFDTGVERSFISLDFEPLVKWKPTKLDFPYTVELANSKTIQANTIIRDSTLTFDDHSLNIDLIPFKLGSFDLVVGMGWLSRNQAEVHVVDKKSEEKKIQDITVIKDYPEVFPNDLPGLPPSRKIEFRIDLIPCATPVEKYPYRLAPSKMQELSSQLQELLNNGFIQPSFSPWEAPVLFVKKKDRSFRM